MKISRLSASVAAFTAVGLLAACGGGGGGGTPPVNNNPGGPPPPTATSTPTQSPTATPTPTQTSPPPPPVGASSAIYIAYDGAGHTMGKDNWQTNGVTDSSDPGDGDITNNVGTGQSAAGLNACALSAESQMTSDKYHVHAFVGIYVDGNAYAIPDAIGMANPGGEPVTSFSCAYSIHTHSASGIIHIEDPAISATWQKTAPPPQYNLAALMSVWGQSLTGLAGGSGMPAIYVGTASGTKNPATGDDLVNAYTLSTASPSSILLQHHTAIWLVYGTPPAAGLPQIDFGISN